jgi:hypothetical protein
MVVGLTDPRMKIEIEVTALKRASAPRRSKPAAPKRKAPATPKRKK